MAHRYKRWAAWGVFALVTAGWPAKTTAAPRPAAVINQVLTQKKVVALTFDDGPSARWTPKILQVLKEDHVKATFFVIGTHAMRRPDLLQEEVKMGMEIGNHGLEHLTLKNRSAVAVAKEIDDNAQTLQSLGAPKPTLYRLPAGIYDRTALTVLGEKGYRVIGWSIDTRDWRRRYSGRQMAAQVEKQAAPGSIIIFHDGPNSSEATVDAVKAIIPALTRQGYQFDTVGQMLKLERQR